MTCPCHGGCQASASRVSPVLSSASKHSIGAQFSCGLLLEVQPGTSVSGSLMVAEGGRAIAHAEYSLSPIMDDDAYRSCCPWRNATEGGARRL